MSAKYADIIIDISHEAIDRAFQYEVPDFLRSDIAIGMQVAIPFGKHNSIRHGYVVGFQDEPQYQVDKIKQIQSIEYSRVRIESELIQLAVWMKETYGGTFYQALKTVLPVKDKIRKVEERQIQLLVSESEAQLRLDIYHQKHYRAKERLLTALLENPSVPYQLASRELNIAPSTFQTMEKEGVIQITVTQVYRNPLNTMVGRDIALKLNLEQQKIVNAFRSDYDAARYRTYLLYGVTGSGKTEVYMQAIEHVLKQRRQVIVLIPEIALTFQTVMRFRRRFGDRVTILNSKMSRGERYDQYQRAKNGEVDIVIGPRSALFMPFCNVGLIVLDEEHEGSYKSDSMPQYHAREVAIERAKRSNASVILGSATPSISSYYHAIQGNYILWKLTQRVEERPMPEVEVVDLREELKHGNRSRFSYALQVEIKECLQKKEQVILFMNRRGYASFVSCRSCGSVIKCPHCEVSLTYHDHTAKIPKLKCHYCGYQEFFTKQCKVCGSKLIGKFGSGTQMIEAELNELYPQARILRMDADTVKGKNGYDKILQQFSDGEADILVGTQMIVKGHDFANVTLVGILAADLSLHTNDYMAGERTFDLLTQAAGRAGRGNLLGKVVIQTYDPEHYAIKASSHQNYEEFYEYEMAYRRLLRYPPVYQMLVIFITSHNEERLTEASIDICEHIHKLFDAQEVYVIGPGEATISKVKDIYRRVVYLKHIEYNVLVLVKNELEQVMESRIAEGQFGMQFDFNPMNSY